MTINSSNIVYANTQSAERGSKATNILVRIDNSTNQVHQIVKRKRTKDGNVFVSTSTNVMDEDQDQTPGFREETEVGLRSYQVVKKLSESLEAGAVAATASRFSEQITQFAVTIQQSERYDL
jgi:hypothetical protein